MKIKVSDFIVQFLLKNDIKTLFTITGGFAMHLNDSFGKTSGFEIYYQHHEQACAYSAVGYAKTISKPAIVCTTAGCAATNAITPCLVAHQDSIPVLFISGQVKSTESIRKLNNETMKLRHYAGADCDIISMVSPITKYAHEILDVSEIKPVLIRALTEMLSGRQGPVWLSIPVDIQGMLIDETIEDIPLICEMEIFKKSHNKLYNLEFLPKCKNIFGYAKSIIENISNLLKQSKRPIIIAGNGIKLGNCCDKFNEFLDKYKIPVVVSFFGTDLIQNESELYVGKIGLIGDRAGNFSVQNSDLVLVLGCRMAQGIIGYRSDWFAREAKIIYIDNDENELMKENINYTLKVNMDLNDFFNSFNSFNCVLFDYTEWISKCNHWKRKWQFEMPFNYLDDTSGINPYFTLKTFFELAPENKVILTSSGSIITNVWHMCNVKKNDKFIISSQGDMGFELTAAIGASVASKNKMIIPILGEGSFQLNIQELQTIIQYKLPIKILLFNNGAYGAIEITQSNFFKNKFGVDYSSGLSFPNTEKIAYAYGINYLSARKNEEVQQAIEQFLKYKSAVILEIFSSIQVRCPRLNAIKNDDGTFTNRPFEDMDPFMSREEFEKEMLVNIV